MYESTTLKRPALKSMSKYDLKASLCTRTMKFLSRDTAQPKIFGINPNCVERCRCRAGLPDFSCYIIPKLEKMYQINTKCTKWSYNIPNVQRIFQMAMKCINIFQTKAFQNWPKLGFLVWKQTNWQPTLVSRSVALQNFLACSLTSSAACFIKRPVCKSAVQKLYSESLNDNNNVLPFFETCFQDSELRLANSSLKKTAVTSMQFVSQPYQVRKTGNWYKKWPLSSAYRRKRSFAPFFFN
jgi:hypothetical protein